MMRRCLVVLLLLCPAAGFAQAPVPPAAGRVPLLLEGKTALYQRVVTRPGATLSPQPGAAGRVVPGFTVYYVYTKQGSALEVGATADGRTVGWIAADKAIEWQHTMIAAFTNPAGRKPVLFLDSERNERLLMLDGQAGAKAAELTAAAQAAAQAHRDAAPVMAIEPATHVDFTHNFYLMPIIDAQTVEREFGPPLRLLQVISVPAAADRPAVPPPAPPYRAGVVFVLDTTMSMQPYIDRTREAIRNIVARIGASPAKDDFRFGLVAYRDSLADNPGLGYPTRVYARPDFSQPASAINAAITEVAQATSSSTGFDEDPIGGIKTAIDEIDWNGMSGRFLVLVTDAGARPSTHRNSLTQLNIAEIRELARAKGIAILAIHLLTPEGRAIHDHEPARAQYTELTRFDAAGSLYFPVPNGSADSFATTVEALSSALLQQVATASGHAVPGGGALTPQVQQQMEVVSTAMRLTYLGRTEGTRAPDVLRSWTTDRDLADPELSSLEVRVLLTRNQLSDLAKSLKTVLDAGIAQRLDSRTFFTQLRSAFAASARDPSRIASAQNIGALLGEYLDGLPYQSDIMNISEPDWLSMGAIAQRTVLNNVEAKLRLYQEYQAQPDLWVDLSGTRSPGEAMYPVPLEALP